MPKHFKLKRKPIPPKKIEGKPRHYQVEDSDSLQNLLDEVGNASPEEVTFEHQEGRFGDSDVMRIFWTEVETDEVFAQKVLWYQQDLAEYESWYAENKEAIIQEKLNRNEKYRLDKLKSNTIRRKLIEDDIAKLELKKQKLEKRKKDLE